MADASSSDTTSDSYFNECFSDISSEKSFEYVVGSQRTSLITRCNERNFLQKLYTREIRGSLTQHNYAPEERLFTTIPSWRHLSLLQVIPKSALQAGHIVMGLTQCGRFLLTYTYNVDVGVLGSLFKYFLHWWAFTPNRVARKVAEVTLFGNYSIYKELSIVIAQWPTERNKLVIHGLCSNFQIMQSQQTDKAFITITTVPSLSNCKDCQSIASSYEEDDLAANWDTCVRCNCLQHGLTVHTAYEVISPYPKFRAPVCLNYSNHIVVNTGNFLHVLRVDLDNVKEKNQRTIEKQDASLVDIEQLDVISISEAEETKAEQYDSLDDKELTPESASVVSPKCDSTITEYDFNDEMQCRVYDRTESEHSLNTSSSNQSDYICDNNKSSISLSEKVCMCLDNMQCQCGNSSSSSCQTEHQAISVRDKILQDFCEDMSQELSIGSDLITLVKHPPCSPRSTPQRLPSDWKTTPWSPSPVHTPPLDILKTRNSDSSHRNSPQPGASQGNSCINITSFNSPLYTLSIGSTTPSSPRLMSPPITKSFRPTNSRKRTNIVSPTSNLNSQPRTRASYKLNLEAEKAYEFTDDALETCEKLSSFRKRRLADKKYEFCDETEDAENIVPFKHVRDQSKHRGCSIYQISPVASPLPNGRRHQIDSEHSESEDFNSQDSHALGDNIYDMTEKNVLRPLNQNQLLPNICRERTNKPCLSNVSPLVPKATLQYPLIKCTSHFKRSYIHLDDERTSVITDVEDEETGGYVSYQCVLPMQVHGADYVQMGMISNAKAEKLNVPCVSIHQMSFDIETFSHHIADWQCKLFKKKYWHCSDYDIEIIDICALSGDIILLLIMKVQTSEQGQCTDDRKQHVAGCKFTWNVDSNQYRITDILKMKEIKSDLLFSDKSHGGSLNFPWNPTKLIAPLMRQKIQQPYARRVRFLSNELTLSDESITRMKDFDNLVEFYITPMPNCS
ncbi:hypothetical protein TSAR_005598 [Trichomalopsis sarcophagae]|uniref:DDB1- and CUL4-associated factor 15 WD40 repeat-containing domain-containing protein n=1 Tax=Trichomalopsis sarcophagae TaxID=543379 RepID=A0A232FE04_9HYME|nr:hypothetical protein TSAR_005598 [Trichomalopsis sarcophagae]